MSQSRRRGRRQIIRFVLVGLAAVAVDLIAYRLGWGLGLHTAPAKTIGSVAGTIFAYISNRVFTFNGAEGGWKTIARFGLLYGATIPVNVGSNEGFLWLGPVARDWLFSQLPALQAWIPPILVESSAITLYAFCGATLVTAILNFIGMRHFVFRPGEPVLPAALEPESP